MVNHFEPVSRGISQPESPGRRRGRWQMSLAGLISLVLAAGVTAAVVRQRRSEVWGERVTRSVRPPSSGMAPTTVPVPIERTAGLVLEVAAVFLILILARSIFGLDRGIPAATVIHGNILGWALLWCAWRSAFYSGSSRRNHSSCGSIFRPNANTPHRFPQWERFMKCGRMFFRSAPDGDDRPDAGRWSRQLPRSAPAAAATATLALCRSGQPHWRPHHGEFE